MTEPTRRKPTTAAKGGRFLAAGAAIGLSLTAVGAMAAAADAGQESSPVESNAVANVQRVVIPQPATAPQQIVIVLPSLDGSGVGTTEVAVPVTPRSVDIVAPAKPTPPKAQVQAPEPVTESGGS